MGWRESGDARAPMEFRVLGPLQIISSRGETVEVRQRLHRAVLAVLLLYAGSPCTHARLIDALWGDNPPKDPAANLATHICRIRCQLGLGSQLQTLPGAYRLDPVPGSLDLHRFQLLTTQAQQARDSGDLPRAAALQAAALDCWREPPLADLPSTPGIDADVAGLLEQRRVGETALVDLMLALGHHEDLLAGLHRSVVLNPLDERGWAQLMLALYRSDRKCEALAAYSRARAAMIAGLGTEPGPALKSLMERILADSEDLAAPPGGGVAVP
jgi:DNA-binding SARP family transcriptional activator